MSRKNDDEFSSGENADYSDLELDPETGQIVSVSAEGEQITVASIFEESEPASMLTADRLLRDEARPRIVPETFGRRLIYRLTFGKFNPVLVLLAIELLVSLTKLDIVQMLKSFAAILDFV